MIVETNKAHLGRNGGSKSESERGEEEKESIHSNRDKKHSCLQEIEGTFQFWMTFIVFGSSLLQHLAVLPTLSSIKYPAIR